MAGPLAQYRPVSIPTGNQKFDEHHGEYVWRRVLKPSGFHVNGRPREYTVTFEPVMEHILMPRVEPNRPSKHARGRTRARTAAEQTQYLHRQARLTQHHKTMTVNAARLGAIYDEVPGVVG